MYDFALCMLRPKVTVRWEVGGPQVMKQCGVGFIYSSWVIDRAVAHECSSNLHGAFAHGVKVGADARIFPRNFSDHHQRGGEVFNQNNIAYL